MVEIRCPADCSYLATSREHPPAAIVRQQQRDVALVVQFFRDLNQRQSQLFLLVSTFIIRYESPELHPLIDDDLIDAVATLASTLETSARGVIYEHRAASGPGERLIAALKPMLAEAGKHGGTSFERDAAFVLRRVAEAARAAKEQAPANRRAFIDLLARSLRERRSDEPAIDEAPRLIVP
jgi:hypothetical protein